MVENVHVGGLGQTSPLSVHVGLHYQKSQNPTTVTEVVALGSQLLGSFVLYVLFTMNELPSGF